MRLITFVIAMLVVGCGKTAPEPVPDAISYVPAYVDVVTAKTDQMASGLSEVQSAVKANTEVLLQIKELINTQPTTGGVEPTETPSSQEMSPPPVSTPYWETDRMYVQYYGATWCGPCRTVKPRAKRLAKKYGLPFTEFDVDKDAWAASISDVTGVPVVTVCRKGKQIGRLDGATSEQDLDNFIRKYSSGAEQ